MGNTCGGTGNRLLLSRCDSEQAARTDAARWRQGRSALFTLEPRSSFAKAQDKVLVGNFKLLQPVLRHGAWGHKVSQAQVPAERERGGGLGVREAGPADASSPLGL